MNNVHIVLHYHDIPWQFLYNQNRFFFSIYQFTKIHLYLVVYWNHTLLRYDLNHHWMLSKNPRQSSFDSRKSFFNPTGKQQSKTGAPCLYICRNVCWLTSYNLNRLCRFLFEVKWIFTEQNNPMTKRLKIDFDYLEKNVRM